MPKVKMDYQNTIIYKIVCNDLSITDCYVGHTTNFIKRKCAHKYRCTNENDKPYNLKIYKTIRDNSGWDNWSMIEVEKYPCNDINEALARERYWLEQLNAKLNVQVPLRTKQEYDKANFEKRKDYRELNKDKIREQIKTYRELNKDKIREQSKTYYELNKDKIREQSKTYYELNKDKLNEKIICNFCQCPVTRSNILKHQKTTKKCLQIQSELVLA